MDFCKSDRTLLCQNASPGLTELLEGALQRVLDHQVVEAAVRVPEEAVNSPEQEQQGPVPPVKDEGNNANAKGSSKPAKSAAKGKKAAPVEEAVVVEPTPPPPAAPVSDEYSQKIDAIRAQCQKRIMESLELEQYLKQQHDKADQDKAADFAARDQEFTRFWRYTGLPHIAPLLVLNKSKLQNTGLLDHQDIISTMQKKFQKDVLSPPDVKEFSDNSAAPHYLVQTAANLNRAQSRAATISKCKKSIAEGSAFKWHALSPDKLQAELKACRAREALNRKRMNGDQWDAERKVIESIHSKLQFCRNPRYEMRKQHCKQSHKGGDPLLNRPKFGIRPAAPKRYPALTAKQGVAFVCEPDCIAISDWKVGVAYEFPLQVRNVSHTLQQMRVVPLVSKNFHISQASLPGPDSIIAPGMHASLRVKFTPDSLRNFTESLKISTPLGKICVPLRAVRSAPAIDLPPELDLGPEYVGGGAATRTVTVTAKHGNGAFRIMAAVDLVEGAACTRATGAVELTNGFSVQPSEFSLSHGCKQELTFSFRPTERGVKATTFVVVCDNCTVHEFVLKAEGLEPDAWVHAIDGKQCCGRLPDPLTFPPTIPGSMNKRSITILNSGSAALPFRWALEDATCPALAAEDACSGTANLEPYEAVSRSPVFMVMPSEGVLRSGEEVHFEAVYAPGELGRSTVSASFMVTPSAAAAAHSTIPHPDHADIEMLQQQLTLIGSSVRHPATVTPTSLTFPRQVPPGCEPEHTFYIRNPCRVPAHFSISTDGDASITLSPHSGVVPPHTVASVTVTMHPDDQAAVECTLTCSIKHGCVYSIHATASFTAAPVAHWLSSSLDFGLLPAGSSSEAVLRVCNPCESAPAPFSASAQFHPAPGVTAEAVLEFPEGPSGTVPEGDAITLPVRCTVWGTGHICGLLTLESNQQTSLIPVCVATVAPAVAMLGGSDVLDLSTMYVGVPEKRAIQVQNASRVAANWKVRERVVGQGCDVVTVIVEPSSGVINVGQAQEISIRVVASSATSLDLLVVFDIEHAKDPLVVALQGSVQGMSVQYSMQACPAVQAEVQGAETVDEGTNRETARLQAALNRKLVDFGSSVIVGNIVEVLMTVSNDTGIEALAQLRMLNFAAQDAGGAAGAAIRPCAASGGTLKGKMLLSSQHEVFKPFMAPTGNNILRNRRAKDLADSVLNNKGMAISITPPTATLPPFGTACFRLKLMSNMIGSYEDILECSIGNDTPQQFVVRAGIIGSPVHLQKEASLLRGLFDKNITSLHVYFGVVPKGVQATRSVSVFNLSSFQVAIAFHLEVFQRSPLHAWTKSDLQVKPDGSVALAIRENIVETSNAQPLNSEAAVVAARAGPFTISPSSVSLNPGASERITITFASEAAHTHEATLHGTQTLHYNASSVSVSLREAPLPTVAAHDNPCTGDDSVHRPSALTEMFVRGAFHPHAAPPPRPLLPLAVALSANCRPCGLVCDEGPVVQWCVHSTHAKHAPAFCRSFTLCNTAGCPLRFTLRTSGPFQVTEAIPSVPQDDTLWTGATFFSAGEARHDGTPATYFLPPHESIALSLIFLKPKVHGSATLADSSHEGQLLIYYANGQQQELSLKAAVLHPRVECITEYGLDISKVDFGLVRVGCNLRKAIVLQNPTQVEARWSASVEGHEDEGWSPDAAFQLQSRCGREGVLEGAEPISTPGKHTLEIEFCPKTPGRHCLTAVFAVARGKGCVCQLTGLATFDEAEEPKRQLMGLP